MTHTPTPWQLGLLVSGAGTGREIETVAGGQRIAGVGTHYLRFAGVPECYLRAYDDPNACEANTAFIVRACNAHDELLAACLGAQVTIEACYEDAGRDPCQNDNYCALCDAIAKAEETS